MMTKKKSTKTDTLPEPESVASGESPVAMTPEPAPESPRIASMADLEDIKGRLVDLIDSKFTEASAFTQLVNDALIERLLDAESRLATLEGRADAGSVRYPDNVRDYEVKPGDTLVMIAKNELGNSGHFTLIGTMNYDRYPSLRTSQRVEPGWKLRLPPR
jgi:nucleoid-associated protein YgaU